MRLIELNLYFCILILSFGFNQYETHVEAISKHANKPLGSWYSSLEQLDLQDIRSVSSTTDHTETAKQYKKKHKKKRFKKKDNNERRVNDGFKPKKKRKKKQERKFVKTVVRESDGDYNASSSIEYDDHRKPVDIIVHIKMHD